MGPTNVSSPRLPRVRGSPSLGPHGGARLCDAVGSLEASCHRVLSLKWHLDSSLEPQAGGRGEQGGSHGTLRPAAGAGGGLLVCRVVNRNLKGAGKGQGVPVLLCLPSPRSPRGRDEGQSSFQNTSCSSGPSL